MDELEFRTGGKKGDPGGKKLKRKSGCARLFVSFAARSDLRWESEEEQADGRLYKSIDVCVSYTLMTARVPQARGEQPDFEEKKGQIPLPSQYKQYLRVQLLAT